MTTRVQQHCKTCQISFPTPAALAAHRSYTDHGLTCDVCHKRLATKRSLAEHVKNFHGEKNAEEGKHTCSVCGRAFKSRFYLASHVLIHTGATPHVCAVCDKGFGRKDMLKRHMATHGRERHVCGDCGKEFSRRDKLKEHQALKHWK